MTNIISVPPEMVEQWVDLLESHSDQAVFTLAAHWGYTQAVEELEEFLKETVDTPYNNSMTDKQHPITPPPELVSKWCYEDGEKIKSSPRWFFSVCAKAAQWGADQELEACCKWTDVNGWDDACDELRAARRPKPPSLKEEALEALEEIGQVGSALVRSRSDTIRRALEQLND